VAVEETSLGYWQPDGNELFKSGDETIAHNAGKNQEHIAGILSRLGTAEANIDAGMGGGPGLVEDPLNPGTYFMADSSPIAEDPFNPGLYTF
jgi:hypothetical protein